MTFRSILCPVDFSSVSRKALRTAASLARSSNARMTVMFVDDPLLVAAAAAAGDTRASTQTTQAQLERFVARTLPPASRPRRLSIEAMVGRPADLILETARQSRADLIVMGTRGMGGVSRMLLGSTAEAVVTGAKIPVLAVPS